MLGHPIAHSLSPALHRAAYSALGLDWTYDAVDCRSEDLRALVEGLDGSWAGLSLTMPLKQEVLALLDEAEPLVGLTGAANTVLLREGRRIGANTDVEGIVAALAEAGVASEPMGAVLGGGATARSAVVALARRGVSEVTAYLRRPEAGADLVATGERAGTRVALAPWTGVAEALAAPVVVTTVPKGVADDLAAAVPASPGVLLDVVYDPWPTPLAAAWARQGGRTASGLAMLLHQAVGQVRLFTGLEPPVDVMRAALQTAAAAR